MSRISILLRASIGLGFGVLAGCALAQAPEVTIPASRGTTLTGIPVVLPDAVKGKVGVLVVGFTKDSKTPMQAWGKRLAVDYPATPGVVFYEIPVLASAPSLARLAIEEEMKMSMPAAERAHLLPLTQNEAGWLAVTHYVKGDDAYVLLIGGNGVVRWQTQGPVSDANYAELKSKIGEMQAAMSAAGR
jgi:hypothetical protein